MKNDRDGIVVGKGTALPLFAAVVWTMLLIAGGAGAEDAPAVTMKVVTLNADNVNAERVFAKDCGRCHAAPDPAAQKLRRQECGKDLSPNDLDVVREYLTDVQAGKELYETRCNRCHDLIEPGSHTAEYWSKNMCTSKECFVQNPSRFEEQQLLLYLSSHSGKK